ncbi:hypothetical protein pdul_cds_747 [Pandoravirus dulcis]|uniref:Ankyrin repeat domain containing protein n=1 Tax=Pandoravirus dulcis TaxID=1349409 RepID=S4VU35_9VIRU|nr:hypothetical protein pdul_cds_747 [Pandoravirus dulcis]AGO82925.1 hypothetical protein pdul_cds_747 [Pandoravirus dulcis]
MTSWATLPVEMRAAVLDHIDHARDFVACMLASRLFYEATGETQRRMWRYAPDRSDAPNVFNSDEPVEVVVAVWNRWAHRLELDYEQIVWGPARSGRLDVLRFACAIASLTGDAQPVGPCLCLAWHECACGDPERTHAMRSRASREAVRAAAASGLTDAVLYLVNATAVLADLRPDALCAAARHAQIHVIEALFVDWLPDEEMIARMVDNALDLEHPNVVLWLHDRGWLTAEVVAPFMERLVLVAAACACMSEFEGVWRLLVSRKPDSVRRWWRATMLRASHTGNVGALDWLLNNLPDPGMPSSSQSANIASHALVTAIEYGHVDAATLLRERGVTLSLPRFQCALRQAKDNGCADAIVPICASFHDPAFMGDGSRLVECACAMDHADLLAFACDRFGPHLAQYARRSARAYGLDKCAAVLLWLDQHFPA